jgi:hypothetical protein
MAQAAREPVAQAIDRGGLVTRRLERGDEGEVGHVASVSKVDRARWNIRSIRPTAGVPAEDDVRVVRTGTTGP